MTPAQALALKPGTRIVHALGDSWVGKFVRLEGPFHFSHARAEACDHYRIWWKGWCTHEPEREDWTWEWAVNLSQ